MRLSGKPRPSAGRHRVVRLPRQRQIEQVNDDRIDDFAGVQQFQRRFVQRAGLQVRPERVFIQEVLVFHRVEERLDGDVAESQTEIWPPFHRIAVESGDVGPELPGASFRLASV